MRLHDQIRAVACVCWIGTLGSLTYFACDEGPIGAGVIREGLAASPSPSSPGAQDARSRTRTELPHTGDKPAAKVGSPGFALGPHQDEHGVKSAPLQRARHVVDLTQGVRLALAPEKTKAMLREPGRGHLQQLATDAANLCGVPPALFHALIERESSWRPYVVSKAGAVGLAQVKPSTGREISRTLDVHDPWQNLVAGGCYLRKQYDRFGTWRKALHAYRLGPNARVSIAAREYATDIIEGSAQ